MESLIAQPNRSKSCPGRIIPHPGTLNHKLSLLDLLVKGGKLIVPGPHGFECYRYDQLHYFKAQSNYTEIHTRLKKILVSKTLKAIENQLPEKQFCRVHSSYLVNIHFIKSYINTPAGSYLVLEDNTRIPVSRSRKSSFRPKDNKL